MVHGGLLALRDNDSHVAAMSVLGMLSTVHRWAPYVGPSAEEIAANLGDLIIHGLSADSQ